MLYLLQLSRKKIQPLWLTNISPPIWDLNLQAPASYVIKWDTGLNPVQSHSHPPNPAPPANNGASGKWIVLGHNPPNLRVHLRPNSNGLGTRLRRGLAPQTMVPRMRQETIQLCLSYSSDRAQALDPKSDIQMDSVLRVIGTVARHKESLIPKRHWSGLFTFNLLSGPSPAFRSSH